jgi:cysteine desulfurase/selenocysteine lyase
MNESVAAENLKTMPLDIEQIRRDFPILHQQVNGKPLVYLDNAATAQKPHQVIETVAAYYRLDNANVHRGVHTLSQRATDAYEGAREKVKTFLNAASEQEIVFVRGATEGINLVAQSFGRESLQAGDEILITEMEHHSNIVPWQMLCEQTGATLKYVSINDAGELNLEEFDRLLTDKTRIVALVHISNALGTINPVEAIIRKAHAVGARVLLDGAQAAPHIAVDVQALDCDFYVLSGHKLFAPTGIGVLYGKQSLLESMPPYQGGGDMIKMVSMKKTLYNDLPYKFEAGTPHISGAIGLGAAIDYLNNIGLDRIQQYEHELLEYGSRVLAGIDDLTIKGTAAKKTSILSFVLKGIHPHDIGTILDNEGIAIRAGHHCAMPIMERFGLPATARASLAFYNTREEIDRLAAAIIKCREIFN